MIRGFTMDEHPLITKIVNNSEMVGISIKRFVSQFRARKGEVQNVQNGTKNKNFYKHLYPAICYALNYYQHDIFKE